MLWRVKASSKKYRILEKSQSFDQKIPRMFPLKGQITERMCGDLLGNSFAKDTPERVDGGENAGDLSGDVVCEGCPLKEKKQGGFVRVSDWGKWAEKLQKLSFLRFEMVQKSAIFQQTKGQNLQTSGSFYFRRSHSSSEEFDIFCDYAGRFCINFEILRVGSSIIAVECPVTRVIAWKFLAIKMRI